MVNSVSALAGSGSNSFAIDHPSSAVFSILASDVSVCVTDEDCRSEVSWAVLVQEQNFRHTPKITTRDAMFFMRVFIPQIQAGSK